ncbi:carbohydrate kinase [Plantactinospora siamensis]|uniref:Carbohydrate kinase n=1 Tax=Plantactinospora siamensis TaxID=555372 RepID=A0ABV6P0H3_9ACTN
MFTVLGETVVDLLPDGPDRYAARPGGSPLNVAVALARLGQPAALLARLSAGPLGRRIRDHALANGVDLAGCPASSRPATLAVATVGATGAADYDFYLSGTADWHWRPAELAALPDGTAVLHTGSLTAFLGVGADLVAATMRRAAEAGVLVSFDPNVRPAALGDPAATRSRLEWLAGYAHLVKASDEDLRWLYPDLDPGAAADRLGGLGPALVVVTLGGAGALGRTRTVELVRPARAVTVVDTVGAGDAFTAGLLAALAARGLAAPDRLADIAPAALAEVLDHACLVGSLTCERPGADPPYAADLRRRAEADLA